jgi:hypothetical protein
MKTQTKRQAAPKAATKGINAGNPVNVVYETRDYDMFGLVKGNRAINRVHVEHLKTSFKKQYLFTAILVNTKLEIIDGQHRFQAAKELRLPVRYIIAVGYGLEEVQVLNSNMRNWAKVDYLKAFCDMGYEHYLLLQSFMKRHPQYSIGAAEALLTNRSTTGKSKTIVNKAESKKVSINDFKHGRFEVYSVELAEKMVKRINDFAPYFDGYNRTTFVRAMIGIFRAKGYSHKRMMTKVAYQHTKLQAQSNVGQYRDMLEEIYNYRASAKISFKYA